MYEWGWSKLQQKNTEYKNEREKLKQKINGFVLVSFPYSILSVVFYICQINGRATVSFDLFFTRYFAKQINLTRKKNKKENLKKFLCKWFLDAMNKSITLLNDWHFWHVTFIRCCYFFVWQRTSTFYGQFSMKKKTTATTAEWNFIP